MKQFISTLLLALLGFVGYCNAQDVMVVEKKDKTTVKYNVDDVQRVYFEAKQAEPSVTITPSTESGGTSSTGVSNLTQTGVTISAKVTISNTTGSYTCGIVIGTTSSVSASSNLDKKSGTQSGNGVKTISYSFSGLTSGTTYYYKVYVLYGGTYYYGTVKSFTTTAPTPTFSCTATTTDATNVDQTTATLNGNFMVRNAIKAYTVGFLLSTNSTPTPSNALRNLNRSQSDANYDNNLKSDLTDLTTNTKYYYRAYILYDGTYHYGTTKSFTTKTATPTTTITVTTTAPTDITQTTAILHGTAKVTNATKSYKIGFFLSTSSNPSASNYIKDKNSSFSQTNYDNNFYADATGLSANTMYYYRAYVLYDGEYHYGTTKSFTTKTATPTTTITVTTTAPTDITQTTAILHGTAKVTNATKSYKIGFFLSTSSNPSASNYIKDKNSSFSQTNYDNNFYADATGLSANTMYYYRAYVLYDGEYHYGTTKSFTTQNTPATTGTLNGHAWVDLGLPDGTKWATCNVGASTPEGYGDYYAWGETATKATYTMNNWKYKNVNIGEDIAGTQYDVAHVKWGSTWKMPSKSQMATLMNNCSHVYTTQNGVKGMKFTGPNGNSIFLPAASGYQFVGGYGMYWTSTGSYVGESNTPYYLEFSNSGASIIFTGGGQGFTIRPVTE